MTLPIIISPGDAGHVAHHEEVHELLGRLDGQTDFLVTGVKQSTLAGRPAAGAGYLGLLHYATDVPGMSYCTGAAWRDILSATSANTFTAPQHFSDDVFFGGGSPWIDVRHSTYGAAADDTTDDTDAFNDAFAAATPGTIVYAPAGNYYIAGSLTGASGVAFRGAGIGATRLRFDDSNASYDTCISATGTLGVTSAMTANTTIGNRTVQVVNGAAFAAGDEVYLYDSFDHGDGANSNGTFVSRVHSVSGNTLTLDEALPLVVYSASGGTVRKITAAAGMVFSDFTLKVSWTGSRPTYRLYGIKGLACRDSVMERVKIDGTGGAAAYFLVSRSCHIRGCHFDRQLDTTSNWGGADPGTTTTSRAVLFEQSTACTATGNVATKGGFGIVCSRSPFSVVTGNALGGGATNTGGRGIKIEYLSNFSTVTGNVVHDFHYVGIYNYASAYVAITGNVVFAISNTTAGSGHGIVVASTAGTKGLGHHCTVSGNTIRWCQGSGIVVNAGTGGGATATFNKIADNTISDVGKAGGSRYAIHLDSSYNTASDNICDTYGSGNTGIAAGSATTYNEILDNECYNAGSGFAVATAGSTGPHFIAHNTMGSEALSLNISDVVRFPRFVKNGVPSDADFLKAPPDGQEALNRSTGDLYIKSQGNWRHVGTTL